MGKRIDAFLHNMCFNESSKHMNEVSDYCGQETWCGSRSRLNSGVGKQVIPIIYSYVDNYWTLMFCLI